MNSLDTIPGRVLVVDDDPISLAGIVKLLSNRFDVSVARNGVDAIRLATDLPFDVILLDVEMPGMDGIDVCRRLKAEPLTTGIPIVFLTAHGHESTELEGLDAGASDFIVKPARGPAVEARVRNLVRLKRMTEKLRAQAQTDDLTGLRNRGMFVQVLEQEWYRARRHRTPVSMLILDVDYFKAYNDRYGHLAGDGALRQVAKALKEAVNRTGDLPCRYGGEEFTLILPSTDAQGARAVAINVMEAIASTRIFHEGSMISPLLTVSIGIVTEEFGALGGVEDNSKERLTQEQLDFIGRADSALYEAKRHGRNQAWACYADGFQCVAGGRPSRSDLRLT